MKRTMRLLVGTFLCLAICDSVPRRNAPSILQKMRDSADLAEFRSLLDNDWSARQNVQYGGEVTVFAPTNDAFWRFHGSKHNLANYHIIWYAKTMKQLEESANKYQETLIQGGAPLWITWTGEQLYVNNALVRRSLSDYISNAPSGADKNKHQVLHVIDQVLNPMVKRSPTPLTNPTCLQLLLNTHQFDLNATISLFRQRVATTRTEHLYNTTASKPSTFFIPVDAGMQLHNLDEEAIRGHIIPNRVLFLRPTAKNAPFSTLADEDRWEVVIMFTENQQGDVFIKSYPISHTHAYEPLNVRILEGNIPLENGVAHLIAQPLGAFRRKLTVFPFLPIIDKVAADPTLTFSYDLGVRTRFNQPLADERQQFTYFVPNDRAWNRTAMDLDVNASFFSEFLSSYGRGLLGRHLIVGSALTMGELLSLTKGANEADLTLNTASGKLVVGIEKLDDSYYIYWLNKAVKVIRADYICTNGIIHVISDVFITKRDVEIDQATQQPEGLLNLVFYLMSRGV